MAKTLLAHMKGVGLTINQRVIVHDIDLEVHQGKVITLIGPNGAGKSSVIKLLLGLYQPTQGSIWRETNTRIGYVPQRFQVDQLMPLTVERFMQLGHKRFNRTECLALLEEVGITHLQHANLQGLSGGEMQRVLLTRALLNKPDILVLDEPGQGIDVTGLNELYQLIANIKHHHDCAVVMVSHDLHLVMNATDQVFCLNQHICCSGQPEAVTCHPEYLRLFGRREETAGLAVYTHHHDHQHNMHGDIVAAEQHKGCTHG